jgi:hypothetical protein
MDCGPATNPGAMDGRQFRGLRLGPGDFHPCVHGLGRHSSLLS